MGVEIRSAGLGRTQWIYKPSVQGRGSGCRYKRGRHQLIWTFFPQLLHTWQRPRTAPRPSELDAHSLGCPAHLPSLPAEKQAGRQGATGASKLSLGPKQNILR